MTMEFDKLCKDLSLDINQPSEAALLGLRQWYIEHVSQDKNRRVDVDSVRDYLEHFIPHLPLNPADSVPAFLQMNAVQYAAVHGYDRFLDALPTSTDTLFNQAFQNNMTPLHLAAMYGRVHAVQALLQHGADPYRKNNIDQYPIQSSLFTPMLVDDNFYERKTMIFNALKMVAPDTLTAADKQGQTVAHQMAMNGYCTLIADLIRENPSLLFTPDHFMKCPIHLAILNKRLEVVKLLLPVHGIVELMDTHGCVALHYAARSKNSLMLDACFPYYSTVDVYDQQHKTPLLYAAEAGNLPSMVALIEHNANAHAKDMRGFSVLHYAVNARSDAMVAFILDHLTIDVNDVDDEGHSALYYAKQKNLTAISTMLIKHGAVDSLSVSPK